MAQNVREGSHDVAAPLLRLGWIMAAVVLAVGAGWGAYDRMGGMDTPLQKAAVVAAGLCGLGVAVWFNRLVRLALYAAVVILAVWLAGLWLGR